MLRAKEKKLGIDKTYIDHHFARIDRSTLGHYGNVEYTQRLFDMIEAVKKCHESRKTKERKIQ